MPWVDLGTAPLWFNIILFVVSAAAVWLAGTRLSQAADTFADKTGVGRAFVGALLLGGITSLPEATTTITAVAIDNVQLAINNVVGGVAMQVVVLALADAALGRHALARQVEDSSALLQAALLLLVLAITALGLFFGDTGLFGIGYWTLAVALTSAAALYLIHNLRERQPWVPKQTESTRSSGSQPVRKHWLPTLLVCSAVIIVAGIVLTQSADAVASQTGLHAGFIGAVTVAFATSLPEISTTIGAVRLKQFTMAYANIFGANLLDLALLLLADIVYRGGPVLDSGGNFAVGVTLLAIILTAITLAGLIERRRIVIFRVGLDSLLVMVVYLGGLALLYQV